MTSLRLLSRQLRSAAPASRFVTPTLSMGNATAVDPPKAKEWTRDEIQKIYDGPLMDLVFRAVRPSPARPVPHTRAHRRLLAPSQASVHRLNHPPDQVSLLCLVRLGYVSSSCADADPTGEAQRCGRQWMGMADDRRRNTPGSRLGPRTD